MLKIPYGATVSYGDIAKALERKHGGKVSAQAVGGAVGWNPKTGRTQRKTAMKKLMVAALAAIGLNTSFSSMKKSGVRPMIHGFVISALVVIVALVVEIAMGIVVF